MPLLLDCTTPCLNRLEADNIVWRPKGTVSPDLRVAILNLMPEKELTEYHLLSRIGHSTKWLEPLWLFTESHTPKNTTKDHLDALYTTWSKIRNDTVDGFIVTGAPVELMPFEDVHYWPELQRIFDWAADHCAASYAICWAAQAALYHFWDIDKSPLPQKLSGIFPHQETMPDHPLLHKMPPGFSFPYSRYTGNEAKAIRFRRDLEMAAFSEEAGPAIISDRSRRLIMVTGHPEYDRGRLQFEYNRDRERGLNPLIPANAFEGDDPEKPPLYPWHQDANQLYLNWLERLTI